MSEAGSTTHQCECAICQAGGDEVTRHYHQQINLLLSRLTEPQRRWYVGVLSAAVESPSDRQLALITGVDEKTIQRGRQELAGDLADIPATRQRRVGGGRPRAEKKSLG
jgi:hypothetical protein